MSLSLDLRTHQVAHITGEALSRKLAELRLLIGLRESGFRGLEDYCGRSDPDFGRFPAAAADYHAVFAGSSDAGYSHHATLARLGERYIAFWACGALHEDRGGQTVLGATSTTDDDAIRRIIDLDVCALPAHLAIQEMIVWPMVQEVVPL